MLMMASPSAMEPPLPDELVFDDCVNRLLGDAMRSVPRELIRLLAMQLVDEDLFCFRLACRAFRDHAAPAIAIRRSPFLRTRALAKWAWEALPEFILADKTEMLILAASVGAIDVVAELIDGFGCKLDARVCAAAASRGRLGVLIWLRGRGCPWDRLCCYGAARGGHLAVIKYAHEQRCPWNEGTCAWAAFGGHLEIVRYLHEQGCPWNKLTCAYAAGRGHLHVLVYAHEHGCPWDEGTCACAADGGHLDVLKYAHERGCPWNAKTCRSAADGGHFDLVRYAHKHGCPRQ